jgi:putative transcriptional regulator
MKNGNKTIAPQLMPLSTSAVRAKVGLSQSAFAKLLGVSVRTLQEWEQGRRKPSGAAQSLLSIAQRHPEYLHELTSG